MSISKSKEYLSKIKWAVYIFVIISGLMCLLMMLFAYSYSNSDFTESNLDSIFLQTIFNQFRAVFSILNFLYWIAYLGIIVFFLRWVGCLKDSIHNKLIVNKNIVENLQLAFFVPAMHLFIPIKSFWYFLRYLLYAQAHFSEEESKMVLTRELKQESTPYDTLLIFWWLSWLLAFHLYLIRMFFFGELTLDNLGWWYMSDVLKYGAWTVSSILLFRVMTITQKEMNNLNVMLQGIETDDDLYDALVV